MLRQSFAVLAAVLLLAGCASSHSLSREMAGWEGGNVADAIAVWGLPEESSEIAGQTVLIWRDRSPPGLDGVPAVVCQRMLAVSREGTITGWRWRGDACVAEDLAMPRVASSR